jgi:hypothetical protein
MGLAEIPMMWNLEEFKEYRVLQEKLRSKTLDSEMPEFERYKKLANFYQPIDNEGVLIDMYEGMFDYKQGAE